MSRHIYFDQEDCYAIINRLPLKTKPQPEPEPVVRWGLMAIIAAWAMVVGLVLQWVFNAN